MVFILSSLPVLPSPFPPLLSLSSQTSEASLVLSDSEVDRYQVKTQGDITRSLSTAEEGGLASLQNGMCMY